MVYGRVEIISKASLPVSQEKKNGWWQRYTCVIALGKTETRTSRESEPETRWGFSRLCFRKGRWWRVRASALFQWLTSFHFSCGINRWRGNQLGTEQDEWEATVHWVNRCTARVRLITQNTSGRPLTSDLLSHAPSAPATQALSPFLEPSNHALAPGSVHAYYALCLKHFLQISTLTHFTGF